MAGRHVIDMHEVEARIDKAWHAPARRLDDDAARRGRPHVTWTDGSRRVDDHRRQPGASHHALDQSLGNDLASFIRADGAVFAKRPTFVRRSSGAWFDRGDTAGVDDSLCPGPQGLLHEDARSFDVGSKDVGWRRGPEPVVGSGVDQIAHAPQRRRDRVTVADIAHDNRIGGVDVDSRA